MCGRRAPVGADCGDQLLRHTGNLKRGRNGLGEVVSRWPALRQMQLMVLFMRLVTGALTLPPSRNSVSWHFEYIIKMRDIFRPIRKEEIL